MGISYYTCVICGYILNDCEEWNGAGECEGCDNFLCGGCAGEPFPFAPTAKGDDPKEKGDPPDECVLCTKDPKRRHVTAEAAVERALILLGMTRAELDAEVIAPKKRITPKKKRARA